jgi:hypothetical protein
MMLHDIAITPGPASFAENGQVSVFPRSGSQRHLVARSRPECRRGRQPLRAMNAAPRVKRPPRCRDAMLEELRALARSYPSDTVIRARLGNLRKSYRPGS